MGRLGDHQALDDGEDLDVCGCDFEVDEGEATRDDELPAAFGGVQAGVDHGGGEDVIDGCDLDFNAVEPTNDVDLPIAIGGVK